MSASLVGSEMCIRDRGRTPRTACVCGRARGLDDLASLRLRALPGCAAVSYTHLTLPTICSV
eukprot:5715099-Alexandrium_andersonii.AAC.1